MGVWEEGSIEVVALGDVVIRFMAIDVLGRGGGAGELDWS